MQCTLHDNYPNWKYIKKLYFPLTYWLLWSNKTNVSFIFTSNLLIITTQWYHNNDPPIFLASNGALWFPWHKEKQSKRRLMGPKYFYINLNLAHRKHLQYSNVKPRPLSSGLLFFFGFVLLFVLSGSFVSRKGSLSVTKLVLLLHSSREILLDIVRQNQ